MSADDYIAVLRDQQRLEKAFKKESANVEKSTVAESSTEVNSEVGANVEAEVKAEAESPVLKLYKQKSDGGWEPTDT